VGDNNVVISISTEHKERKAIEIDFVKYELADPNEMGFKEFAWLENTGGDIQKLLKGRLTDNKIDQVVELVDKAVKKIVIDLPDKVLSKLSDKQKMTIITSWSEAYKESEG